MDDPTDCGVPNGGDGARVAGGDGTRVAGVSECGGSCERRREWFLAKACITRPRAKSDLLM
eukprot:scaffold7328_cov314-Pinguiococcus_pyrenoidosus.AAC.17